MTTYTAPPDKADLVLSLGDILDVHFGGTATDTTIGIGGIANVNGGTTIDTTIKALGVENVGRNGTANDTTISRGGTENIGFDGTANHTILDGGVERINGGVANGTIINDGREEVYHGTSNGTIVNRFGVEYVGSGVANNTTINGGLEDVIHGTANNVIFAGSGSHLALGRPSDLQGTISNWRVSDVIDLRKTDVTSVHENDAHTSVTINYFDDEYENHSVTYSLVGQQADTEIEFRSDGHGGTDLVLVPVVGVQHHEASADFGPLGFHF